MTRRSHRWRQGQRGSARPPAVQGSAAPSSVGRQAPLEGPSPLEHPSPPDRQAPSDRPLPADRPAPPERPVVASSIAQPGPSPIAQTVSSRTGLAGSATPQAAPASAIPVHAAHVDPMPAVAAKASARASTVDLRSTAAPVASPSAAAQPMLGPELDGGGGCTAAQLRRFIKSRAYVPLHELRRRFELPGSEDDVSPVPVNGQYLYVGLPRREASLLGELLSAGDVGYELLLDPASPLVIGVFPMRPVPRG